MAWVTPKFRPGLNKLDPGLANKGGYWDSNLMRVLQGMWQPVGGWILHTSIGYEGVARGSISWRTLEGKRALAWGTTSHLYAEISGSRFDITPNLHETVLTDCFTTENGSPTVWVHLNYHRLKVGDTVVFSNHQTTVGGLTIEGTFPVASVETSHRFTITFGSNASSTVSTPGGGNVDFVAPLPAGLTDNPLTGYGTGTYGEGEYGGSADLDAELRTWTFGSWGEFLLANPLGYGLFEYQPEIAYPELAFNGGFDGNADGWALGTGWAYGSNKVTKTAGTGANLSQDVEGVLEGGKYYLVTFTVTRSAGSIKFRMNAGLTPAVIDVGTASAAITKSGTYTRLFLCPADPMDVVFEADNTFAGDIDSVSYKLVDRAYRITTAPPRIDAIMVEPRGVVIALGTTLTDGSYSGTAYRSSALGNNRTWIPDTDNIATEENLVGIGGRLMGGVNTSEQNLVWSDEQALSFQYVGAIGRAFNVVSLGKGCGLISRHSMCAANGFVFWMANTKQFFAFRGIEFNALGKPEPVLCRIQGDVFNNIDYRQALKINACIVPEFSEAWFSYPDMRDKESSSDPGECSRIAVVAWTEGGEAGVPWATHRIARTSMVASGTFQNPIMFGAIDDGHYIFDHETGRTANGQMMEWWLESSPFDAGEGENMAAIKWLWLELADQAGNINVYLKTRYRRGQAQISNGPFVQAPGAECVTPKPRLLFRDCAFRIEPVNETSWGRLSLLQADIQVTGAKR